MTPGSSTRTRLLEQLLAGLVALEHDNPQRFGHPEWNLPARPAAGAATPSRRDDGFRLAETPGERRAAFCRLEHVVPWFMQGPHWEAGEIEEPPASATRSTPAPTAASRLPDVRLLLVRHRGEHRIPDAFCSADHLAAWAKAGGRYSL